MKLLQRSERTVIYTALAVLGAMNLVFLLSLGGRSALAAVSALADVLGPAEALQLTEGEKQLDVKAKSGRLTWGPAGGNAGDFRQTYTFGFVDITKIMNPLMESEAFKEERDTLVKELETTDADYRERLDAFGQQVQGMDQNSPEGQAKLAEARALYEEYMNWSRGAMERRDTLDTRQIEQSYRELAAAVDVVAEKLGVDIVLRFIPTAQEFQAQDAEQALTEIRLRAAVRYPEALDITSEVLEELSIQAPDS